MSCKFSIPFSGSSEDTLSKAKSAITGAGGTFSGDVQSGAFELPLPVGKITGDYLIAGADLTITILQKPIFISCNMLEQKLKEYISGGV